MDLKAIKKNVLVEDDHIILGEPLKILKYGKIFNINQIRWVDWEKYSTYLGIFLTHYYVTCGFSKLPDSLNDVKEFRDNIRTTLAVKPAFKALMKLMKVSKWNTRFVRKKFTLDDIAELFIYSYLFNVAGVKKNFSDVLKEMKIVA